MTKLIEATYDGKVFSPDTALDLKPNTRYLLHVQQELPPNGPPTAWDTLETMIGILTKPSDWAANHDAYLYPSAPASSGR